MTMYHRSRVRLAAIITAVALGSGACSAASDDRDAAAGAGAELSGPRLVITTEDAIHVLDRATLEPVASLPTEGFVRINAAGDDRHVLVSQADGFQLLDTGVEVEEHGDHAHYRAEDAPSFGHQHAAREPGHVTVHDGVTALFSDGEGTISLVPSDDPTTLSDTIELPAAHHGVAVMLGDLLLHTEGTADERSSVVLRDSDGAEVARTDDCPGVHGEATATESVAVVGCEDGVIVVRGDDLTKVDSPDAYGRIGNQAGSSASPIVLGDYKSDPDAELERPERVALIDTETETMELVDLGTSYSFRSLARGAAGEALVLGTDGALHVIDARDGSELDVVDVVEPWQEPVDWQQPRPALHVAGDTAWVTEPATSTIHEVDIASGSVVQSAKLPGVPNEIVAAG